MSLSAGRIVCAERTVVLLQKPLLSMVSGASSCELPDPVMLDSLDSATPVNSICSVQGRQPSHRNWCLYFLNYYTLYSFTHLFNKYLWSACQVPDTGYIKNKSRNCSCYQTRFCTEGGESDEHRQAYPQALSALAADTCAHILVGSSGKASQRQEPQAEL